MDYAMEYALMSDIYDEMTEANEGIKEAIGNALSWLWDKILFLADKIGGIFKKKQKAIQTTSITKDKPIEKGHAGSYTRDEKIPKDKPQAMPSSKTAVSNRKSPQQVLAGLSDRIIKCIRSDASIINISEAIGVQACQKKYQYKGNVNTARNSVGLSDNLDSASNDNERAFEELQNYVENISNEGTSAHTTIVKSILSVADVPNYDSNKIIAACDKMKKLADKIKGLAKSGDPNDEMEKVSKTILKAMNRINIHVKYYDNTKITIRT